jgi:hypothetical protein
MIWQLMQTLGSSERYEVALDIFNRKKKRPVKAPRMIITGTRHPEGGVKILISLYGFPIGPTELYFRKYVYCYRAAIRDDG